MKNALVLLPVTKTQRQKIQSSCKDVNFRFIPANELCREDMINADIIVGNPPAAFIKAAEHLKLLQLSSAGADAYIVPGVLDSSTILCNASGAYGKAVSEHAFASMLMLQKKLHLYRDDQHTGEWSNHGSVSSLSEGTVLIVGLGDIGLKFARLLKGFDTHIIGVKRRAAETCPEEVDELYTIDKLDELLPRADVVVSILPHNSSTHHIFSVGRFELMKSSAIFINCGRGSAVDPDVLYEAVHGGKIAAAAVDVTEPEPLPKDHRLWSEKNVLITPHVAGYFFLASTLERVVDIAIDNINRLHQDLQPNNIVNFQTGYRD